MTSEGALVRQAAMGDPQSFDALIKPYIPRIYRLAFLITRREEAAADAVQEALWRAYRSLPRLKAERSFYPWLARIVANEAIKQSSRGRRFFLSLVGPLLPKALAGAPALPDPEGILQAREEQLEVWAAVQKLSPAHRAVIVLRYYEELSEAEMAEVLSIRPGTVKSRLYHARAALEKLLGPGRTPAPIRARVKPAGEGGESHD